jgi:hypothetical protein
MQVWPGTLMLLCTSFTEVACNWKSIYSAARIAIGTLTERFYGGSHEKNNIEEIVDPVPPEDRVPFFLWAGVLVASIVVTCIVMGVQYGQNVGITILGETRLLS